MNHNVMAFQPRKVDPPHFVAEEYDDLEDMVGGFIGAEQCDGCGNSTYIITARPTSTGHHNYFAVCAVDESDPDEFKHPEPCGAAYSISHWDPEEVVF